MASSPVSRTSLKALLLTCQGSEDVACPHTPIMFGGRLSSTCTGRRCSLKPPPMLIPGRTQLWMLAGAEDAA